MATEKRGVQPRRRGSEPEQLALWKKRGGKRRGAGRPPKGTRAGSPHKERPFLHARYPVHVTLRVVGAVGTCAAGLRKPDTFGSPLAAMSIP